MIKIAICEDDRQDGQFLKDLIETAGTQLLPENQITVYPSGDELLKSIKEGAVYDLLVLDIFMDGMNGLETARKTKELLPDVMVGFVTSSLEFAVDAFELDALHYLVKPVKKSSVEKLLERYLERQGRKREMVEFIVSRRKLVLQMDQIQKVESYKKGVILSLTGGKDPVQLHSSFMSVEEKLNKKQFIRIARGLTVNMNYIAYMEQGVCKFIDGTSALISRRERREVEHRYKEYQFFQLQQADVFWEENQIKDAINSYKN